MSGKHLKRFFFVNAGLSYVMRPFEQLELKLNQRTRVCMELIMTNGISYREKGLALFFWGTRLSLEVAFSGLDMLIDEKFLSIYIYY